MIDYISFHVGCSKEDIVDGLSGKISRNTIFKYLPKMATNKQIIVKHINKRDTKIFVQKDNPLVYIPQQLKDFENAYEIILITSQKRITEKDFGKIARFLKISKPEPSKWSKEECLYFMNYETRMIKTHKSVDKVTYVDTLISQIEKRIATYKKYLTRQKNPIVKGVNRRLLDMIYEEFQETEYIKTDIQCPAYVLHAEVSIMIQNSIKIFFLLVDTILLLGLIVWPRMINDKESLETLYSYTSYKISQIQFKLVAFLASIDVFSVYEPAEYLMRARAQLRSNDGSMNGIISEYRILGMYNEIITIIHGISKISNELRKYEYHGGRDKTEESLVRLEAILTEARSLPKLEPMGS